VLQQQLKHKDGKHETYFDAGIFLASGAMLGLFYKGLSSPAGAAATTLALASKYNL
jgi:hypothetical protein